ncbi:P-loop NTPase fold protein, partial [Exiguobacterium artemiae]
MNQDRLLNILIAKNIDITKKPFTFLIKGTWGIGKTFLWNEFVERKNGTGKLKFIKFSLFGVESIEQLERQLRNGFIENNSRMKEAVRQSYNVFNKKIAAGQIE